MQTDQKDGASSKGDYNIKSSTDLWKMASLLPGRTRISGCSMRRDDRINSHSEHMEVDDQRQTAVIITPSETVAL